MNFKLVKVDHSKVLADIEQQDSRQRYAEGSARRRFNTSFHTENEAPDQQITPSEKPYSFKRWLPLILRSRGLASSDAQVVAFSHSQARLLLRVANASIPSCSINRMYREDIDEDIVPVFRSLFFPPEGLFMRLAACSAKDGMQTRPGKPALRSVEDILLLLLTSLRARNALVDAIEEGVGIIELFFIPWNSRMRSEREYRVFCPPFRLGNSPRITAISQYRWYKQWLLYPASDNLQKEAMGKIVEGSNEILKQIAAELETNNEMDNLLMRQGLTFDVFFDEERDSIHLVELNVFGVRSACGSCLFQWIWDRNTLEGRGESEELEFRVTY
ncbi:hypothetical protein F5Y03DRAFT_389524 [Xylaria venustula]|nr:hypothetical protein F5Y03DRAFT_389524 [Xylaria venustula]